MQAWKRWWKEKSLNLASSSWSGWDLGRTSLLRDSLLFLCLLFSQNVLFSLVTPRLKFKCDKQHVEQELKTTAEQKCQGSCFFWLRALKLPACRERPYFSRRVITCHHTRRYSDGIRSILVLGRWVQTWPSSQYPVVITIC